MNARIPVVLVAEDMRGLSENLLIFLSEFGGAVAIATLDTQSAVRALDTRSFDFVICDGTGWENVHDVLATKMKDRYCVYSGDHDLCCALHEKGIKVFPKGNVSVENLSDWVLTKLRDEGFSCTPGKECRDTDFLSFW